MKNKVLTKLKNMPKEAKASFAYTICNIIQRSLSFITLPLFTRLLTTAQYGQYTIYTSWMSIFAIFITLELPYGTFNTAMIKFKDDRDGYISSAQTICSLFMTIFLFIYIPFNKQLSAFMDLPSYLIFLMAFEILFQSATTFWMGKKRFEFKYISVIVVTLLVSILGPTLAYILVVNSEERGYARILGCSIVVVIVGFSLYVLNYIRGKKAFNKEYWKYALSFNIPLLIYYLAQMIFGQSDRLMINYFCGEDKAGIYGVAYNLGMILTFVLNAINNAYTPWVYNKINDKKPRDNRKISCYISILIAVLLLFIIWMAPEIIYILAGKAYMEAIWIVPPVAMSLLLLLYTQFSTNIEFLYKKKTHLILASVGAAVVNIVLNYIFIPKWGYYVAGYTTLISYVIFAYGNYLCIRKYMKKGEDLHGLYNWKLLLLIFAVFMIAGAIGMALYNLIIVRYAVMVIAAILLFVFRKKIIQMVKNLKKKEIDNVPEDKELIEETQE